MSTLFNIENVQFLNFKDLEKDLRLYMLSCHRYGVGLFFQILLTIFFLNFHFCLPYRFDTQRGISTNVQDNLVSKISENWIALENVRIRSYSDPYFSRIVPHLDWIRRDAEYLSVLSSNAEKCGKNADQNNSEYGHFLRSDSH